MAFLTRAAPPPHAPLTLSRSDVLALAMASSSPSPAQQLQQAVAALQLLQCLQGARAELEQRHLPAQLALLAPYLRLAATSKQHSYLPTLQHPLATSPFTPSMASPSTPLHFSMNAAVETTSAEPLSCTQATHPAQSLSVHSALNPNSPQCDMSESFLAEQSEVLSGPVWEQAPLLRAGGDWTEDYGLDNFTEATWLDDVLCADGNAGTAQTGGRPHSETGEGFALDTWVADNGEEGVGEVGGAAEVRTREEAGEKEASGRKRSRGEASVCGVEEKGGKKKRIEGEGEKNAKEQQVGSHGCATAESSEEEELERSLLPKMRALQDLVPNSHTLDPASLLDHAINYVTSLQNDLQVLRSRRHGSHGARSQRS